MRVLGIDPGTATTGFGVIESEKGQMKYVAAGVITTSKTERMSHRLLTLYKELSTVIAEFQPQLIAVELLFFARNVTTAITVGQARGVVLLAAAQAGVDVVEFTPLQVKSAITGYGKADKRQVQEMVKNLLSLPQIPKPDDAADGLAVAICAAQSKTFGQSSSPKG